MSGNRSRFSGRHYRNSIALLGAGVALACGGGNAVNVERDAFPTPPDSVFVRIINDTYYDARVRAVYEGGLRYPMGTIGGNRTQEEISIPWQPRSLAFEIQLIIGPGTFYSDEVDVAAGDLVELRLPPNIESSGLFRRRR